MYACVMTCTLIAAVFESYSSPSCQDADDTVVPRHSEAPQGLGARHRSPNVLPDHGGVATTADTPVCCLLRRLWNILSISLSRNFKVAYVLAK